MGNTILIIVGFFIFVALLVLLFKSKRSIFVSFIYSLPLLSRLALEVDLTRFCRSMALLISSGIPITDSLELCKNVVIRRDVYQIIKTSKEKVAGGKKLYTVFRENNKLIPQIMIRITEAGEKSGTIDKSMQELTEHFDAKVSSTLKTLTTLLEPMLLLVIGIMVGGMMLAIIAPIYNLIGKIRTR